MRREVIGQDRMTARQSPSRVAAKSL